MKKSIYLIVLLTTLSLMAEKLRELHVQIYVHIHKNYQQ